jgi:type IV secretion system protein VirB4
VALAFAGASTPEHQRDINAVLAAHGAQDFAAHWLRHCGLDWAADLIPSFSASPSLQEISP